MPSNTPTALVIFGGVAFLIALIGGGVKIGPVELPKLSSWIRGIAAVSGLVAVVLGVVIDPNARWPLAISGAVTPTVATPTEIASSTNPPTATPIPPTSAPTVAPTQTPPPMPTDTPTVEPIATVPPTATTALPADTSTPPIEKFCAFVTLAQVRQLQTFTTAESAIREAEKMAGYRQNDYDPGDKIPANVLIATNLLTSDLEQFGVTPVNNIGGYGLFLTTHEFIAPNDGTYWCIR